MASPVRDGSPFYQFVRGKAYVKEKGQWYEISGVKHQGSDKQVTEKNIKAIAEMAREALGEIKDLPTTNLESIYIQQNNKDRAVAQITTGGGSGGGEEKKIQKLSTKMADVFAKAFPFKSKTEKSKGSRGRVAKGAAAGATAKAKPVDNDREAKLKAAFQNIPEPPAKKYYDKDTRKIVRELRKLNSKTKKTERDIARITECEKLISEAEKHTTSFYGVEQISSINAIERSILAAKDALNHLEKISESRRTPSQKADIAYYKDKIVKAERYALDNGGWISTNAYRDLLYDRQDFNVGTNDFFSCTVNMRYQSVENGNSKYGGFVRLGAMGDVRNGWTNLAELVKFAGSPNDLSSSIAKKIEDAPKGIIPTVMKIDKPLNNTLKEMKRNYEQRTAKIKSLVNTKTNEGESITALMVAESLEKLQKQYWEEASAAIQKRIQELQTEVDQVGKTKDTAKMEEPRKLEIKIELNKVKMQLQSAAFALATFVKCTTPKGLAQVIHERRRFVTDQMLQLVALQIEKNHGLIKDGVFKLAHVGLLNGFSRKMEPEGWMHDETSPMLDMEQIFKEFDGKQIIFDPNVQSVVLDGNKVNLPGSAGQPPITLRTYYCNCSPQKNVENEGVQKDINVASKTRWEGIFNLKKPLFASDESALKKMKALADAPETSYELAETTMAALTEAGFAVSTACSSGKDRTGVVAALACQRYLENVHIQLQGDNPFLSKMLDDDAPTVLAAGQGTGAGALKAYTYKVPRLGAWAVLRRGMAGIIAYKKKHPRPIPRAFSVPSEPSKKAKKNDGA